MKSPFRSTRIRRLLELAACGTLIAAGVLSGRAALAAAPDPLQDTGIPVGSIAPEAELQTLTGTKVNLKNYFGKQPVLIEFWATWCPNCKALEPTLKTARDKYGDRMKFVGVAVTVNQSLARVKAHVEEHKTPLDMLWDVDGKAVDVYDVPATSFIVIVDKAGKIVYGAVGAEQKTKLEDALAKVVR